MQPRSWVYAFPPEPCMRRSCSKSVRMIGALGYTNVHMLDLSINKCLRWSTQLQEKRSVGSQQKRNRGAKLSCSMNIYPCNPYLCYVFNVCSKLLYCGVNYTACHLALTSGASLSDRHVGSLAGHWKLRYGLLQSSGLFCHWWPWPVEPVWFASAGVEPATTIVAALVPFACLGLAHKEPFSPALFAVCLSLICPFLNSLKTKRMGTANTCSCKSDKGRRKAAFFFKGVITVVLKILLVCSKRLDLRAGREEEPCSSWRDRTFLEDVKEMATYSPDTALSANS